MDGRIDSSSEEPTVELSPFNGLVWRIMFAEQKHYACDPVRSPVGRFHHGEQFALYTSCTEEGAGVAIKRYLGSQDPDRVIIRLQINAARIYDITGTKHSRSASVVWQDIYAGSGSAPTWKYSDAARKAGAQGMLYASRSRPELTHLVLFDVSAGVVKQSGGCRAWHDGIGLRSKS